MDISSIAAELLGAYLIISGVFLITREKTVSYVIKDFFGHPAVVYLAGALLVVLSSLFLLQKNVWDGTWQTVITVFVWLVLFKGISYVLFPDALRKLVSKKFTGKVNLYGIIAIAIGLSLFYLS